MSSNFALWLGGARPDDAASLREWADGLASTLSALRSPRFADEEPQEDPDFVQAGVVWELPVVRRGSVEEQSLLNDLRLGLDGATAFTRAHPVEVAVQFGCCEVAYAEDGKEDGGMVLLLDPSAWPSLLSHDHG